MSTGVSSDDQLRAFYAASYPRLVVLLTLAVDGRAEAEDVAQEAYARLVPRWRTVAAYDDPEAWVRQVAFRLASNRRRKLRNGVRAVHRHGAPEDAGPPDAVAVDVRRALAALPLAQRTVSVLHHLVGLEVAEVARELDLPVGTVKSRLSRARAALAPLLATSEETTRA